MNGPEWGQCSSQMEGPAGDGDLESQPERRRTPQKQRESQFLSDMVGGEKVLQNRRNLGGGKGIIAQASTGYCTQPISGGGQLSQGVAGPASSDVPPNAFTVDKL